MKLLIYKLGGLLASFALLVAATNANAACFAAAYQPKLPASAKKLRKF